MTWPRVSAVPRRRRLPTSFNSVVADRRIALSFVVQNLGGGLGHKGDALSFFQRDERVTTPDQRLDPPLNETRTTAFPLPRLFRVGLGYDLLTADVESTRLVLSAEFVESNNTKPTFGVGTEFSWSPVDIPFGVQVRGSYAYQPDETDLVENSVGQAPSKGCITRLRASTRSCWTMRIVTLACWAASMCSVSPSGCCRSEAN
jgi:hypothetical protein